MPTPLLQMESPFSKLFGKPPNYQKLKIFGCACYPWLRPYTHHKLDDRSIRCVFLGYAPTQSAYLCLDDNTGRLYVSRHVIFDDNSFPFTTPKASPISPESPMMPPSSTPLYSPIATTVPLQPPSSDPHPALTAPTAPPPPQVQPLVSNSPSVSSSSEPTAPIQNGLPTPAQPTLDTEPTALPQNGLQPTAQPSQAQNTIPPPSPDPIPNQTPSSSSSSSSLPSNQPPLQTVPPNNHPMATRAKTGVRKPNTKYLYASKITNNTEPKTINQALRDEKWRQAAITEYNAQLANHSWDLVPPPSPNVTIVGCRWLFTTKYNADGTEERPKGRLVAKGYNQRPGLDYAETFSLVVKSTTIRIVLGVAVERDWPIRQLDVNNAFLQGTLTDEVYMSQPPGFVDTDRPHYVCRLRKALYGLKQAPRAWYVELQTYLVSSGFVNSVSDTSLFILKHGKSVVYILVYVDDILVTGNDNALIQRILAAFAQRFSVKEHEELHYFLGIEAKRTSAGLHLSQRRYIIDLLERTKMINAKPVSTPMATTPKLTLRSGTCLSDPTEYRKLVGSLQYLAFTRPDISYAVNKLSQFMHSPTDDHWNAVKRTLRYLAGTTDYGIMLRRNNSMILHAFSDADWAGDGDDYLSTNGYIVYLGQHPVSWSSKKQNTIARSSTEAEYMSVANTSSELKWILSLLQELGIPIKRTPTIYCDNVGATYLCANPVFHSRMKHVALDFHFIRNQVRSGTLRVVHVSTKDQLADVMTKPLSRPVFTTLSGKIGIGKPPPS